MKTIKLMGLAFVAILAIGGISAASASAATPKFVGVKWVCDEASSQPAHSYGPFTTEAKCLEGAKESTGQWWRLGLLFTVTSGKGSFYAAGNVITCNKDEAHGYILTETLVSVEAVVYTECTNKHESSECSVHSTGAPAGEIRTVELDGTLGLINKASEEVGIVFKPASGSKFVTLEGSCLSVSPTEVTGGVIGKFTENINKVANMTTVEFAVNTKDEQSITKFETGGTTQLAAFGIINAGLQSNELISLAESMEMEIKA